MLKILRLFHKHSNDQLRFVKYLHGDEINQHNGNRFEYKCIICGASVWLKNPISCQGCKHIYYMSDGSVDCDLDIKAKVCMAQHLKYFNSEKKAR